MFLPTDIWEHLTTDERESLRKDHLPPLEGWRGMSSEDATTENLRQLFRGLNINFSNPLTQFRFPCAERFSRREQAKWEFERRRRKYALDMMESIVNSRKNLLHLGGGNEEILNPNVRAVTILE